MRLEPKARLKFWRLWNLGACALFTLLALLSLTNHGKDLIPGGFYVFGIVALFHGAVVAPSLFKTVKMVYASIKAISWNDDDLDKGLSGLAYYWAAAVLACRRWASGVELKTELRTKNLLERKKSRAESVLEEVESLLSEILSSEQTSFFEKRLQRGVEKGSLQDLVRLKQDLEAFVSHQNGTLDVARRAGCEDLIRGMIRTGDQEEAQKLIGRVSYLLGRANNLGQDTENEVRGLISRGELDQAETLLEAKIKRRSLLGTQEALRLKVEVLPKKDRGNLLRQIQALGELEVGGREFRKALYGITTELEEKEGA